MARFIETDNARISIGGRPAEVWRTFFAKKENDKVYLEVFSPNEALHVLEFLYLPAVLEDYEIKVSMKPWPMPNAPADSEGFHEFYSYKPQKQMPQIPIIEEYEYTLKFILTVKGKTHRAEYHNAEEILLGQGGAIPIPTYLIVFDDLEAAEILNAVYPMEKNIIGLLRGKREIFVCAEPHINADGAHVTLPKNEKDPKLFSCDCPH